MRNVSDRSREIKTHVLRSILFFNRAVYEIAWNNIVEPCSPHMRVWRM